MKVSIQGVLGSFHHIAASEFFGKDLEIIERGDFLSIFEDVDKESCDFGLIAIENTIAGSILTNFDLLLKYKHQIVGEHYLRIKHNLIAFPGQKISEIKEVKSHPMALLQCDEFLRKIKVKVSEAEDTAGVVKEISESGEKEVAGIASELAAEIYRMEILEEEIETDKQNFTRFLVISKEKQIVEGANKTSIAVEVEDKPGALFKFLQVFDSLNVNMTKIESRPIIGKPWNYRFYIDFDLDAYSQKGEVLIESLKNKSAELIVLGSYKRGEMPKN